MLKANKPKPKAQLELLYLARSRCARPLPRHHATYAGYPASPPRRVAELVFWTIVEGLQSPKDEGGKSASGARQSRCDVGAE